MGIYHIFGYGSLIWKPPPFVVGRVSGYIKGYTRRFAQLSHDHRGTPEHPGRVVTLVPDSEWMSLPGADNYPASLVWGVMYAIDPDHADEVEEYLDEREKDGYELMETDVFGVENGAEHLIRKANVYVGHTTNPSFCGPANLEALASQILKSVGPSGPNKEYLFHLDQSVQTLSPDSQDLYLSDLTKLVKELDSKSTHHIPDI